MAKVIGIDLGTSNSAASVLQGGRPVLIPSSEGTSLYGKSFPSYVAFTKDGSLITGEPARRQAIANPEGTVTAFKRKMGTDYKYKIFGKEYRPQELSAFLLQKIKRGRRGVPWRRGREGGHHCAGILQRQPEAGHERCRRDSRT